MMLRKFAVLILAAAFIFTAGCAESTIESANSGNVAEGSDNNQAANAAPDSEADSEAEEAEDVFTIGDAVKFDDLLITLNGVKQSAGSDFEAPQNGQYLILDLTIENTGDQSEAVSTLLQMTMFDADSYSYDIALYTGVKGSLDGEIGAGRKVRGEAAFDVPESASYEFVFEDPFTNGQAIWQFDASAVTAE